MSWNSHTELLESVRRRVRKLFHSVWPSGVFGAKENTLFHSTTQMSGLKAITQKTACWVLMPHTHTHNICTCIKKTVNHIQLISLVRWSSVCPQTGRPGLSNRLRAGNYIPYSTKSLPKTELQGTNSVFVIWGWSKCKTWPSQLNRSFSQTTLCLHEIYGEF